MRGLFFPRAGSWLLVACTLGLLAPPRAARAEARLSAPLDEHDLVALPGSTHPLARAEFDQGLAPDSLPMERMLLVLRSSPEQQTALSKLLDAIKLQGSPSYHHWLTPQEFGNQFGVSYEDLARITGWLESQGFEVTHIGPGRRILEFSGTAGKVARAFHAPIHRFVVDGKQHWANTGDPQIPRALSPVVAGLASLHNFESKASNHFAGIFRREQSGRVRRVAKGEYTFTDSNNDTFYAVGPADLATIYNVPPGLDGTGQTIAIVQRSNINTSDVDQFRAVFGLPPKPTTVTLNGQDPGITADESEALIDAEWSTAVAPGATINVIVSASTNSTDGVLLSALYAVESAGALGESVMSTSFGACELFNGNFGNEAYYDIWQQAAAEGITAFVSAGDSGSSGCDVPGSPAAALGLQVNGLASTPFNVAVGGTDFFGNIEPELFWSASNDPTSQGSALSYIPETPWNDSCANTILQLFDYGPTAGATCNNPSLLGAGFLEEVVGGGGGRSSCAVARTDVPGLPWTCLRGYGKPTWQAGPGVPPDARRDLPDVSLFASDGFLGSFYIVCQADLVGGNACDLSSGDFAAFGGTSVAAPAFAGIMALVNQQTNSFQGNANYDFYKLAASESAASCNSTQGPGSGCIFNDVTFGTNSQPCVPETTNCLGSGLEGIGVLAGYKAGTGYDQASGLGSVNVTNLVNGWPNSTPAFPSPTQSVKETAGFAKIGVTRTGSPAEPLYVTWAVVGGTATQGVDFTTATGNLTLAAGATTGTFIFPVKHDTVAADQTVEIALYPAPGGTPSTMTLTITNVDAAGTVQFALSAQMAPTKASGTSSVALEVLRTLGTASGVTVQYATADDTAAAGTDYTAASGTLTFRAGQVVQFVTVTGITRILTHPSNPTFDVNLTSPGGGASLGLKTTETVTIKE